MPPVSQAQREWAWANKNKNTAEGRAAKEFADADPGGKLPEHKARGGGIGGIGAHEGIHLDTTVIPHTNLTVPGFGAGMAHAPHPPPGVKPSTWSEHAESRGMDRSGFADGGVPQLMPDMLRRLQTMTPDELQKVRSARAGLPESDAASAMLMQRMQGGIGAAPPGHFDEGGPVSPWFEKSEAHNEISAPQGGFLNSSIAGRTDRLPIAVATNSHVLPADVISGLGQDNSLSGARVMAAALRTGPYGTAHPQDARGPGPPSHHPPPLLPGVMREIAGYAEGGGIGYNPSLRNGGNSERPKEDDDVSHCLMAGGEMVIPPHDWHDDHFWYHGVRSLGGGDIEKGHELLRKMTEIVRKHHIEFLKHAPPPKS